MADVIRKPKDLLRPPRRRVLQLGAGLVVFGAVGGRLGILAARRRESFPEVLTLPECVGCTGCAVVCPTQAILVHWPRPLLAGDRCVRCGSCELVCPVGARRVVREGGEE
jgi:NAD-dependent dihydropyrimidine dehydrogenase PreA subunit